MAFSVRDEATDKAVRRLAMLKGKGLTETIREAVEKELDRAREAIPLADRLSAVTEDYRKLPKSGLVADKAFYDSLNDE